MHEYADSSFLVSLYVPDANHPAAVAHAQAWRSPPRLPLTPFGAFELNNTLRHLRFLGRMQPADLQKIARRIREDAAADIYQERPLEAYRLVQEAEEISRRITLLHGTRSLDLLHVAAARLHQTAVFLSFDKNQRAAAAAVGLKVMP